MKRLCMAVAAGLAAAPLLTGCSWFSPTTTGLDYQAGDGREFNVGKVAVRNAMVVAGEDGKSGAVVATIVNTGEKDVEVDFGQGGTKFKVPAGKLVKVSPVEDQQVTVSGRDVNPAAYVEIPFSVGGQAQKLEFPVVGANFPRYATLTPGAKAAEPTSTKTDTESSSTETSEPTSTSTKTVTPSVSATSTDDAEATETTKSTTTSTKSATASPTESE